MAIFLQVRAGPVRVLLDSAGVHEVTGLEQLRSSERGYYEWRDSVIQAIHLSSFLAMPSTEEPKFAVVYSPSEGDAPLLFEVDEVIWLKDLQKSAWLNVEALPRRTAQFFDGVSLNDDGQTQAFRLRRPLAAQDFLAAPDRLAHGSPNGVAQSEL